MKLSIKKQFSKMTIKKDLDNPTVGPVHLQLFRLSVISGPWLIIARFISSRMTKNQLSPLMQIKLKYASEC